MLGFMRRFTDDMRMETVMIWDFMTTVGSNWDRVRPATTSCDQLRRDAVASGHDQS